MLSLKIDNHFIALPDSTEISIEASNPIFSDAGAKTYLFEIPVESLRYIIGNADEIYGESYYKTIDGKRATLYVAGIPIMTGKVALEDEVYLDEEGCIAINLVSGNLEFAQMIEGMNCRDVEQAEEVIVGYNYSKIFETRTLKDDVSIVEGAQGVYHQTYDLPAEFMVSRNEKNLRTNISEAYPYSKYCNIRTACLIYGDDGKSNLDILTPGIQNYINTGNRMKSSKERNQISAFSAGGLNVLNYGAYRRNSGICFYVMYFLDCLMKTCGIHLSSNQLSEMEDFKRLAFVNMRCVVRDLEGSSETVDFYEALPDIGAIEMPEIPYYDLSATVIRHKAVATSENFPNINVKDVIEALENAFGARFIHDTNTGELKIVLLKKLLSSQDVVDLNCGVHNAVKIENRIKGFCLRYEHSDDDTNYYIPKHAGVSVMDEYSEMRASIHAFDSNLHIDSRNGNSYMIKVDEEADESGEVEKLNPSLFEVGSFSSVYYGDCSDEQYVEENSIGFSPIINTDINASLSKSKIDAGGKDVDVEQIFALLLDIEVKPEWKSIASFKKVKLKQGKTTISSSAGTAFRYYDILGSNSDVSTNTAWMPAVKEPAANSYDTGFMLGIMRGPGSDSEPETFAQDFDGEGNYRVAFTAANYAFTSDSIDNCNRDFDYNGTATGVGPDELKGRFSLKLRAGKYDKDGNLIPALQDADGNSILSRERAERGLYDTFWKEYAYFTVNKKILRMTCGMEIADIINLDWTKRYKIGEWTGFIANYSFNVNKDGMSEVELEMYYI